MGWRATASVPTVNEEHPKGFDERIKMTTLHIEHPINDFDVWKAAFDRFADFRKQAGVRGQRLQRPVDDPQYMMIDLDFDTVDEAEGFLTFLRSKVWAIPENSPGLAGTPTARILQRVGG